MVYWWQPPPIYTDKVAHFNNIYSAVIFIHDALFYIRKEILVTNVTNNEWMELFSNK